MTKEELLETLERVRDSGDPENGHVTADMALLDYLDDNEISRAFMLVRRWYA